MLGCSLGLGNSLFAEPVTATCLCSCMPINPQGAKLWLDSAKSSTYQVNSCYLELALTRCFPSGCDCMFFLLYLRIMTLDDLPIQLLNSMTSSDTFVSQILIPVFLAIIALWQNHSECLDLNIMLASPHCSSNPGETWSEMSLYHCL